MKEKINVPSGAGDFAVTGLAYDSRKVREGYIFFAIKGLNMDGNKFISSAIENGAKAVFTEEVSTREEKGAQIYNVTQLRKVMAELSDIYYDYPSQKLKLIGITGTNGKTTTTYLIKSFLEKAGYKTGLMGTIDYLTGGEKISSSLTTPESIEINRMLSQMVENKMSFCVMEVSSIALEMDRTYNLDFDAAVFTNLTSEHLDFHNTMEEYLKAKKILFDSLNEDSFAISNKDDIYGENIVSDTRAKKLFYSIQNESDFKAGNEKLSLNGLEFDLTSPGTGDKGYRMKSSLTGKFNIYNILASVSTVFCFDIGIESVEKALSQFTEVNGRFNRVRLPNGAIAIVDYSHTSDSLKNAIEAAREILNELGLRAKLITVFGCGGNRDKTKRPVMADYSTSLSDHTIITSDNPRFEEPMDIINDMVKGVKKGSSYEVIPERDEAIKRGIEISNEGDIVLICGKGHETYQEIKGVKSHFDDKEVVMKYSYLAN